MEDFWLGFIAMDQDIGWASHVERISTDRFDKRAHELRFACAERSIETEDAGGFGDFGQDSREDLGTRPSFQSRPRSKSGEQHPSFVHGVEWAWLAMDVSARRDLFPLGTRLGPKTRPRCELADFRQGHAIDFRGEFGNLFGWNRQEKFKVFAIAQGMVQRGLSRLLCESLRVIADGDLIEIQSCTATACRTNAEQIDSKSIANVGGCVDFDCFSKLLRQVDPRVKLEVLSSNAAAESSGDHDRIAHLCATLVHAPKLVAEPMAVMWTTRGPSQTLVSPPAIATW